MLPCHQRIDELNDMDPTATFGITKFADMTPEEFKFQVWLCSSFPAAWSLTSNLRNCFAAP